MRSQRPSNDRRDIGIDETLQSSPLPLKKWMRLDLAALFIIFVVFYYFKLSNFSLSIDDEMEAVRAADYAWILTGRWAGFIFDHFLVPQSILPYFPIFLLGVNLTLSYPLLLSAYGVKRLEPVHYLAFGFYAAFPTWGYLAAFATNIASASIGQTLVCIALHEYRRLLDLADIGDVRQSKFRFAWSWLLGAVTFACALGFYQSFFFSFVALGIGVQLIMVRTAPVPVGILARRAGLFVALVISGAIIYEILNYAFRIALNLHDTGYVDTFVNWQAFLQSPRSVITQTLHFIFQVYSGSPDVYGTTAFAIPVVVLGGLIALAFSRGSPPIKRISLLAIALCMLGIPFVMMLFSSGQMPERTLVAVPALVCIFAILGMTSRIYGVALTTFCFALIALLQIIYASNLLQAASYFARSHDEILAASIYNRIVEAHPDFSSAHSYTVDFYGAKRFETSYPRPISSSSGWSFFEWDGGNMGRILNYMHLIGFTNLNAANDSQRRVDLPTFKDMANWPAADSVKVVGDVTLIKLGETPGWPYNLPK